MKKFSFPALFLVILTFRLWLSSQQILTVVGGSLADDQLFVTQALSIVNADWLGEYSSLTLIRGPMYSLWMAFSYALHIPLLFSQQLVYICVCFLLYLSLRTRYNRVVSFLIFCGVLFNPISYQVSERVLRHHFYSSLTIGVVACVLGICSSYKQKSNKIIWWSIGLGVLLAMFYLTREEFLWIVPLLLILIFYSIFLLYTQRQYFFRQAFIVLGSFILSGLLILSIAYANYRSYGAFIINEFKQSAYTKIYGDLLRIKQDAPSPYIVVPKEVVHKAALVSPHVARLEPMLNGPFSSWALDLAKKNYGLQTNEITGAHFIFLLRNAVASLGYFETYSKAQFFFRSMHKELFNACVQKRLMCWNWPFDLIPVFQKKYSIPIYISFHKLVIMIFSLNELRTYAYTSTGNWDEVYLFSKVTRQKIIAPHSNQIGSDRVEIIAAQTPSIYFLQQWYRIYGQGLIIFGLICYCFVCIRSLVKKQLSFSFLFSSGILLSVFLLMILLSYIDAVCFPLINLEYASPIYPLLLLLAYINIYEALKNMYPVLYKICHHYIC